MFTKITFQMYKTVSMAAAGAYLEASRSLPTIKHAEAGVMKQGFESGVIAGLNTWQELQTWGQWRKAVVQSFKPLINNLFI